MPETSLLTVSETDSRKPEYRQTVDFRLPELSHGISDDGDNSNQFIINLDSDASSEFDSDVEDDKGTSSDNGNSYAGLGLTETLIAEIEDGEYVCLICTADLGARDEIWNCEECHRVYHLDCATMWAEKSTKANSELKKPANGWACPSCMAITKKIPTEYKCWCRKVQAPKYFGLTPHSCGQTCGQTLACGHRCTSICHPGPHPECCAMGPKVTCFCGSKDVQAPCVVTPYDGWSCGNVCNELLPCGEHRCQRKCHGGLCYDCDSIEQAVCYCGDTTKDLVCSQKKKRKSCRLRNGSLETWTGFFSCEKMSTRYFNCNNHKYSFKCGPRSLTDFSCPFTPKDSDTCPCGSSIVLDLLGHPRLDCSEPIPLCDNVCSKTLPCGHKCPFTCHFGDCPGCPQISEAMCRCGYQKFTVPCSLKADGISPFCHRRCGAKMHCRRHRCTQICCPHEKSARALEKSSKLGRSLTPRPVDQYPSEHVCQKECGNLKNCKNHRCTEPCHAGPCPPCMESSDEDIACACGRTVHQAPVRCGTQLPRCPHSCIKSRSCGHPMADHPCHDDSEECPKW